MDADAFTIDLHEWQNFADLLIENDVPARRNLSKYISVTLENELRDEADKITATGMQAASISSSSDEDQAQAYTQSGYGIISLETGRAPGSMPPVLPLQIWAQKRGMPRSAGFLIARKIMMMGTNKFLNNGPRQLSAIMDKLLSYELDSLLESFFNDYLS